MSDYYTEAKKEFLKSLQMHPNKNSELISKVSAELKQTSEESNQKIGRDIPLSKTPTPIMKIIKKQ